MCNSRATINQPNQYHHGANPIIKISTFSYQLSTYWPTYPPASSSPPKVQIPNHQPPVKDDQSVKDAKKPDGNSQAVLLPPLLGQPAGHLLLLPGQTTLPILSHLHKVSTMLQPYNDCTLTMTTTPTPTMTMTMTMTTQTRLSCLSFARRCCSRANSSSSLLTAALY